MDLFNIDWAAVEAAMADLDSRDALEQWGAVDKRFRELQNARNKAWSEREVQRHRDTLRALPPNTPLTYRGNYRDFQRKEMLLEKCNPKYVIVQVKDMPRRKGWSRWNIPYADLKVGPLSDMERSNMFINNTIQRILNR